MLHEIVLALAVLALPQEPGSGTAAPADSTARPAAAVGVAGGGASAGLRQPAPGSPAAVTIVGRAPQRFTAPPPGLLGPAAGMAAAVFPAAVSMPADTPVKRPRPRAVEYSDWYARRLAIHRVASYTLLPLLAAQYYTGTQLMAKGSDAPLWVIRTHAPLATAAAAVFGVNTVTGVWNMWEARKDPNGSGARTAHGLLMLVADAGFLAAGAMGHPAVQNGSTRSLHRTVALSSMGVALVGYAIMLPPFRR